jgi:GNAT superfamily N-acetyltransferase
MLDRVLPITVATTAEREFVVKTLVAAFPRDPVLRYLFPEPADYPAGAAKFFGHLFDKRVEKRSIWTLEGCRSVAIWEPPGPPNAAAAPTDLPDRLRVYNDAVHALLPAEPFWYLGVLGTHPDYAGQRYGHAVMAAGLRRAAEERLPAVLETSNPNNVGWYERVGWTVYATTSEPLPIWVMRRELVVEAD